MESVALKVVFNASAKNDDVPFIKKLYGEGVEESKCPENEFSPQFSSIHSQNHPGFALPGAPLEIVDQKTGELILVPGRVTLRNGWYTLLRTGNARGGQKRRMIMETILLWLKMRDKVKVHQQMISSTKKVPNKFPRHMYKKTNINPYAKSDCCTVSAKYYFVSSWKGSVRH